jgi:hypothetical protein
MPTLALKRHLATGRGPNNIALNGVVHTTETESVAADLFLKFADELDAEPQYLGKVTAGHTLEVPIDLKGRSVYVFTRSLTARGKQSVQRVEEAEQTLFAPSEAPTLASATFDTPDIDLVFVSNGGVGDMHILRSIAGGDFGEIATVASSATTYTDTPATVNGTYIYKLTQDGQDGESNSISVTVSGLGGSVGSAPTLLTADYEATLDNQVDLAWTNNGGTGSIVVERRAEGGTFATVVTLASSATSYEDMIYAEPWNRIYYYRVSNTSAVGYSNEDAIFVPAAPS